LKSIGAIDFWNRKRGIDFPNPGGAGSSTTQFLQQPWPNWRMRKRRRRRSNDTLLLISPNNGRFTIYHFNMENSLTIGRQPLSSLTFWTQICSESNSLIMDSIIQFHLFSYICHCCFTRHLHVILPYFIFTSFVLLIIVASFGFCKLIFSVSFWYWNGKW